MRISVMMTKILNHKSRNSIMNRQLRRWVTHSRQQTRRNSLLLTRLRVQTTMLKAIRTQ
jgi:hypothetical protein